MDLPLAGLAPLTMTKEKPPRLIIFTRLPVPGKVKTRLIPALGPHGAAELHQKMTQRTLAWARHLASRHPAEVEVHLADGRERELRAWLGGDITCRFQTRADIGSRMESALHGALEEGCPAALVVGCDCPALSYGVLRRAFLALEQADMVLGPAEDGGYYLVGLKRPAPEIFQGIDWSTDRVLAQTLAAARRAGLAWQVVDKLSDLDRPEDLPAWERAHKTPPGLYEPGKISVIIPAINEAEHLEKAVASARLGRQVEILVVDGGSTDRTPELAQSLGAGLLVTSPSRGEQMRAGADHAIGEFLLFLHADTVLRPGWDQQVRAVLNRPGVSAGAFEFALDQTGRGLTLIEFMVHWRSHLAQMPYGDQAIFIKADLLHELGGMPALPLMEDVELVRRARTKGRVAISPLPAVSSARRWQKKGLLKTTLMNWYMVLAYYSGVPAQRLARRYYGPEGLSK